MTLVSRRTAIALVGTTTLAKAARAQDKTRSLTGRYTARGLNPDGSEYTGVVEVEESNGEVAFAWTVGAQTYTGTGSREGRLVSVDWGAESPVVYVVMPDRELHGTWADGLALEKLSRG